MQTDSMQHREWSLERKLLALVQHRDKAAAEIAGQSSESTLLLSKRRRLEKLERNLARDELDLRQRTTISTNRHSSLNNQIHTIKEDIRIAKNQQKIYDECQSTSIRVELYNTHAELLHGSTFTKTELLSKMNDENVNDARSMDDFISLLYVEGHLLESGTTTTPEQQGNTQGETKDAVAEVDNNTAQGETKADVAAETVGAFGGHQQLSKGHVQKTPGAGGPSVHARIYTTVYNIRSSERWPS
jgi:hypothetical protein